MNRRGFFGIDDPVFKPMSIRQMLQILGWATLITFPLGALSGGALVTHFGADACEPWDGIVYSGEIPFPNKEHQRELYEAIQAIKREADKAKGEGAE